MATKNILIKRRAAAAGIFFSRRNNDFLTKMNSLFSELLITGRGEFLEIIVSDFHSRQLFL